MGATAQVRLDDKAQAALERIVKRTGMSTSAVLREGVMALEQLHQNRKRPRLIGAGSCDSGTGDLSTNKKHMEGFGKKWRNGKWDW